MGKVGFRIAQVSGLVDGLEIFLLGERIQATGPAGEGEHTHLEAHCIKNARRTPGEDPPTGRWLYGLWPGREVWSVKGS